MTSSCDIYPPNNRLPEAKIKVFPTTYFQMLSLFQSAGLYCKQRAHHQARCQASVHILFSWDCLDSFAKSLNSFYILLGEHGDMTWCGCWALWGDILDEVSRTHLHYAFLDHATIWFDIWVSSPEAGQYFWWGATIWFHHDQDSWLCSKMDSISFIDVGVEKEPNPQLFWRTFVGTWVVPLQVPAQSQCCWEQLHPCINCKNLWQDSQCIWKNTYWA